MDAARSAAFMIHPKQDIVYVMNTDIVIWTVEEDGFLSLFAPISVTDKGQPRSSPFLKARLPHINNCLFP